MRRSRRLVKASKPLELETIVAKVAIALVAADDQRKGIDDALAILGRVAEVNRAYVFELDRARQTMSNTHEWCKEGTRQEMQRLQNLPCSDFPWWMRKLANKEVIMIPDVSDMPPEAEREKKLLELQNVRSLLVLPMFSGDDLVGFIGFDDTERPGVWDTNSEKLLRLSAEVITTFLRRHGAEHALKARTRELALVNEIITICSEAQSMSELLGSVLKTCVETLRFDGGGIYLMDRDAGVAVLRHHIGLPQEWTDRISRINPQEMPYRIVLTEAKPVLATNYSLLEPPFTEYGLAALASIPLVTQCEVIGALNLACRGPRNFSDEEASLLTSVGKALAGGIKRKQVEEALQFERAQLLSIFDSINEIIYVVDPGTYEILYVNRALEEAFGKKMVGRICYKEFQQLDAPCEFCTNEIILGQRDRPYRWEYHNPVLNRDYMIVDRIIRWPDGRDVRFELAVDITERKRLEEQLRQSQKLEAVGRLAGGIAHDFNNLLTGVLGGLSLAMSDLNPESPAFAKLLDAETAAHRAAELTQQLLDFSRRESGPRKPANIAGLVREVARILRPAIDPRVALEVKCQPGEQVASVNSSQFSQLLMNLCINARDAMPQGGRLTIETESVEIDENYCAANKSARPGRFVRLTVSDTGCGMDRPTMERMFEPFFTTKQPGEGTGLGLSVAYGIVKQHQGWMECESQPDKGTSFKVYLPVSPAGQTEAEQATRRPQDQFGGTETILIVEDNQIVQNLARCALERLGYHVLVASDGHHGLKLWQKQSDQIDLVLLDVTMPDISGIQVLQSLLKQDQDLKVILTSGYPSNKAFRECLHKRNCEFLHKPYTPDQLAKKARKLLDA